MWFLVAGALPSLRCRTLLLLLALALALAGAILALAAAALLLPAGQRLQPAQQAALPRLEVCLHAAVATLGHVAVTLAACHHPGAAQHPQPLVYGCTHLREARGRPREERFLCYHELLESNHWDKATCTGICIHKAPQLHPLFSHRVKVVLIGRVAQAKHSISQTFEVGFAISEICGSLLQPFRKPLCVLRGFPICVGGQEEHTNCFASALETNDKGKARG